MRSRPSATKRQDRPHLPAQWRRLRALPEARALKVPFRELPLSSWSQVPAAAGARLKLGANQVPGGCLPIGAALMKQRLSLSISLAPFAPTRLAGMFTRVSRQFSGSLFKRQTNRLDDAHQPLHAPGRDGRPRVGGEQKAAAAGAMARADWS